MYLRILLQILIRMFLLGIAVGTAISSPAVAQSHSTPGHRLEASVERLDQFTEPGESATKSGDELESQLKEVDLLLAARASTNLRRKQQVATTFKAIQKTETQTQLDDSGKDYRWGHLTMRSPVEACWKS